ncbi:MAG: O-antigen ligase family protein, partial [Candidatus Omnitrophota bacterium]
LLLFLSFSALSLFNSGPYLKISLKALFLKWFEYVLIFVMVQDALGSKKKVYYAFFIFLATSVFVGFDGLIQRQIGFDLLWQRPLQQLSSGLWAITATFNHRNGFGAYLLFPVVLFLSLLFQGKRRKLPQLGLGTAALLLLTCLMLTYSRGAWLGFCSAMFVLLLFSKQGKAFIGIFVGLFLLFLGSSPLFRDRLLFMFASGGDADRFIYWKAAWDMIKVHPYLGSGLGTFMQYSIQYAPNVYEHYAHNCFLQIWAETGIFSLISFMGFIGILLWRGISALRTHQNPYILGIFCAICGFLVHSFFDVQFYSIQSSVLFWSMAGLLNGLLTKKSDPAFFANN